MADVTIWHNPKCSKSREVLAAIRAAGFTPIVREYLSDPPDEAEIRDVLAAMGTGARGLLRKKAPPYAAHGLSDPTLSDEALIAAMVAEPVLIERPVVISSKGAAVGRPVDAALAVL